MSATTCSGWTGTGPCQRPAVYAVVFGLSQRRDGACRAHLAQVAKRRLEAVSAVRVERLAG